MSLRGFIGVVGVLLFLVGGAFLAIAPLSIYTPEYGKVGCGSAITEDPDDDAEGKESTYRNFEMPRIMQNSYMSLKSRCEEAASTRRAWSIPVAVVGLVAVVGAGVVRPRAATEPTKPNP